MRLGFFPDDFIRKIKGQKVIWLHTVSVGEVVACKSLIRNLKNNYPNLRFVISTVTETGNRIARKNISPEDAVIYSPLDINFIVSRVSKIINPRLFVIAETEIWPNLIINLSKRDIPVVLINGRISARSYKGYRLVRGFLKYVFSQFTLFCMQTEQDRQRIIKLGAERAKVKVTGNMKFDIGDSDMYIKYSTLGLSQKEKLLIAGSTHRGEEKILLQIYKELIRNYTNLRLLIAPRHIERVQEIERLVDSFGFASYRVSRLNSAQRIMDNEQRTILILDTIGQLKNLYARADIVFIGGSLIPHGGQNPIEPAIFAKPIVFGSYMFNFSKVAEAFMDNKAAIMVKDALQLQEALKRLLNEAGLSRELGQRAKELIEQNRGVSLKNINLIKESLGGLDL